MYISDHESVIKYPKKYIDDENLYCDKDYSHFHEMMEEHFVHIDHRLCNELLDQMNEFHLDDKVIQEIYQLRHEPMDQLDYYPMITSAYTLNLIEQISNMVNSMLSNLGQMMSN